MLEKLSSGSGLCWRRTSEITVPLQRVRLIDGLCGNGNYNERTDK